MSAQTAPSVLIVDDDEDFARALAVILTAAGYRVRHACDGDQGVRMAAQQRPDVIILDFMMPIKSGFDACRELRAIPALTDVPIIALTAFGQNIGETCGLTGPEVDACIQECLGKPVEPNVLLERVASCLSAKGKKPG